MSELVKEDKIESRAYQEVISASAAEENTLVVLPTGLGKTIIAVKVAGYKLSMNKGKILILAPTKPLVNQHLKTFVDFLEISQDQMQVMTGETRPKQRYKYWKDKSVFFATPQVVENDLISNKVPVEDFDLVIFDEAHRATGEYSYVFINEKMKTQNLALTASPGGSKQKIMEVADNLDITNFEVRTEDDPDVKPYIQETDVQWKEVQLDDKFKSVKQSLEEVKRNQLKQIKKKGELDSVSNVNKSDLLKKRSEISRKLSSSDDPKLYGAISHVAAALKASQALEMLETQGVSQCKDYIDRLENDDSKAAKKILNDQKMVEALSMVNYLVKEGYEHPKMDEVLGLMKDKETDEKALIFTEYRATVDKLTEMLKNEGFDVEKFIGQSGEEGMSQKEQIETLEKFGEGEYEILVSTSIGEEGLDIPSVEHVIFYEPVPSSIRDIQRAGRTGRGESGNVAVLIAKNTRDEGYYWSAHHKKKNMEKILNQLKNEAEEKNQQKTLKTYKKKSNSTENSEKNEEENVKVIADDRENKIAKKLSKMDLTVDMKRLDVGDFLVSEETVVERKTTADFADSIVDQRLFNQLQDLTSYKNSLIIIEGDNLYSHRDIHPKAIRGAISSLTVDYNLPIIWTEDLEETSQMLKTLAEREQSEKDKNIAVRGKKTPKSDEELKKYIVAGIPSVNTKIAERLLQEFKTIEKIFNASEEELKNVKGIGKKKAKRIKKLITENYTG